ncbi:hypothetical protein CDO52_15095 [Nocardiopsis gilva YIM 90087]|uniref:MFS transporter n=1 Tax=Nocardiopsis gilva YIM 90087 TaxID=1235441 RepID=A0A223SDU0_9ACTN|nr:hypothetical protein [Nocardiopsis gilva]ASU86247.1 hypothetical protein CDO52_15095 [Nocardiopsis gilva YIM 90087]
MSPKKKNPRTPRDRRTGPQAPRGTATAPAARPTRTPVAVDEPARWPVVVWCLLTAAWIGGSLVFFVLYLAEGFALLNAAEITDTARRATAWYLVGLLVCALVVPLAGAVAATVLRRKVAAVMFGLALLLSAALMYSLASPADLVSAIGGALG